MKQLVLETPDGMPGAIGGYTGISFADERERAKAGDVDKFAVASVTLDSDRPGDEQSWGEFLTLADLAALHAWTGALLADHYRE